jgi:guanidinopropionase
LIKSIERYPELADPQMRPRYTGIPTFFRTRYAETLEGVDIGVVGVPFDGGVTHRTGARHGPREMRQQSALMRRFNQATQVAPFDLARVADLGDAWVERPFVLEDAHAEIGAVFDTIVGAGVVPLSIGGDHSISLPILRAVGRGRPVGMVHVDAHCDTGDDYLGSRFHHGAPFRRAVDEGLIDPRRVIQIGIRGTLNVPDMWAFSHSSGMRVMYIEEFADRGWAFAAEEARRIVGDGPTYFSFDIDALDPAFAPGTGTPVPGGLASWQALELIRGLSPLNLVGMDIVEVSPPFDNAEITALAAAHLAHDWLCVLAAKAGARAVPVGRL